MDAENDAHGLSDTANGSYHSYLVRLWQQTPDAPWRASAQSVQSGMVVHFADLSALFQFLSSQICADKYETDNP